MFIKFDTLIKLPLSSPMSIKFLPPVQATVLIRPMHLPYGLVPPALTSPDFCALRTCAVALSHLRLQTVDYHAHETHMASYTQALAIAHHELDTAEGPTLASWF